MCTGTTHESDELKLNKRLDFDNKKFWSSPFKQKWEQLAGKERVNITLRPTSFVC